MIKKVPIQILIKLIISCWVNFIGITSFQIILNCISLLLQKYLKCQVSEVYNKDMNNNIIDVFKVLQDPIRIRIIEMLRYDQERREFLPETAEAGEGFCPEDILAILKTEDIHISNTKLSYHLKELKRNNIIYLVKEGKRYFYLFNKDGLEIVRHWIDSILE